MPQPSSSDFARSISASAPSNLLKHPPARGRSSQLLGRHRVVVVIMSLSLPRNATLRAPSLEPRAHHRPAISRCARSWALLYRT